MLIDASKELQIITTKCITKYVTLVFSRNPFIVDSYEKQTCFDSPVGVRYSEM